MSTNIVSTWKRHGFKPTTEAERLARQQRAFGDGGKTVSASVTQLDAAKRKVRGTLRLAGKKSASSND
jgi:hypothetical protein